LRNIIVERLRQTPLEEQRLEIVERKGSGAPRLYMRRNNGANIPPPKQRIPRKSGHNTAS
jgi:hypothetical protein